MKIHILLELKMHYAFNSTFWGDTFKVMFSKGIEP
jgi:hypothetical protein